MFPATKRLSRPEFNQYFSVGKRFHHTYCTVIYSPQKSLQVAVVVGKKVAKKAVDRNRLRRRVYSATRRYVDAHPPLATGVFIIILKPAAATASRADLSTAVSEMFAQISNSR